MDLTFVKNWLKINGNADSLLRLDLFKKDITDFLCRFVISLL
jgi:hypothetical protein